jgi:hypothetical protein
MMVKFLDWVSGLFSKLQFYHCYLCVINLSYVLVRDVMTLA